MGREQDTSGDYGYDLAHEAVDRTRASDRSRPDGEKVPPAQPRADGEDFSYDEAHDF